MSSTKTVYLNLPKITEIHRKDIFLADIADIYCSDVSLQSKCRAQKICTIRGDREQNRVLHTLDLIRQLESLEPQIQVNNIGELDTIISFKPPHPPRVIWQWMKTIFVCCLCFSGAAFAIMTFNNDVNVQDVMKEVYRLITGKESDGFTVLELTYSIGLAVGILVFFNHFAKWKLSADPTPLEVEMRLYEDNISKTVIQNDTRKEREPDVR
ncbi:MAG: stage V sporulation protein AA [Clostridiales bacterium]|nr:stage V sporulation protein AA [Clostridiales bacterium]